MIKTKLLLILLVVGLAGCQQKSEIDKCVEALEKQGVAEGGARLMCLKAQSGK